MSYHKTPRLFCTQELIASRTITLPSEQGHYLNTVLRCNIGDKIRLFDGKNGEWVGTLTSLNRKNTNVELNECIRTQPITSFKRILVFAPIKKARQEWMIEKAVELGVTDLYPLITQNTEIRTIKDERLHQQIIEACEQSERLDIPVIHEARKLGQLNTLLPSDYALYSCLEREQDSLSLAKVPLEQSIAVVIGPEGGFTSEERAFLKTISTAVTLGNTILRAETAALKALSLITY